MVLPAFNLFKDGTLQTFPCRAFRFISFVGMISVVLSCNNNASKTTTQPDTPTIANATSSDTSQSKDITMSADAKTINDKLYMFFISNTNNIPANIPDLEKRQLRRLIGKRVRPSDTDPDPHKAVVQIYKSMGDTLRLLGYRGKKKNAEFFPKEPVKFPISRYDVDNVNGKTVILGDLQLEDDVLSQLKPYVVEAGDPDFAGYQYIWFVPELITEPESKMMYLYYRIYASNSPTERPDSFIDMNTGFFLPKNKLAPTVKEIGYANPSPPRKVS